MKTILSILIMCMSFVKGDAQTVAIPDVNFEQFLIDEGIDSDGQINGQVLTSDVLTVTELTIGSEINWVTSINSLLGIEAFINLEKLTVHGALLNSGINISALTQLKFLSLPNCHLLDINLSQNILLEEVYLNNSAFDVAGNSIISLDLSNNPLVYLIGLRNNPIQRVIFKNSTQTNVLMDLDIEFMQSLTSEYIICIEVDDEIDANNQQGIYANWQVIGPSFNTSDFFKYIYSNNCILSNREYYLDKLNIYPNPTAGILYLDIEDETKIEKIEVCDFNGRIIKEIKDVSLINVEHLVSGNYLLRISTSEGVIIKKIIKK